MKTGIFQEGNRFKAYVNGVMVRSANVRVHAETAYNAAIKDAEISGMQVGANAVSYATLEEVKAPAAPRFHVNARFEFLRKTVKMVASGIQASAVISGSGGLGKTHSVRKALEESGLSDISSAIASGDESINRNNSFVVIKGYSTAKGLFRNLFENNNGVIVLDDTDSVLKDPVAINILKAALDSYETRIISWNADMRDDDLPRSFIFTGRVIFISNLPESRIDQAIRSRSAVIDLSMTLQEVVDRMTVMVAEDDFLPEFDADIKQDALAFIDRTKAKMSDVNLRTLITVCKVRASVADGTWEEMAEYLTCR